MWMQAASGAVIEVARAGGAKIWLCFVVAIFGGRWAACEGSVATCEGTARVGGVGAAAGGCGGKVRSSLRKVGRYC